MELSIVVPTYNVEPYLANCLDSLLNQDLPPGAYEIIVVNDGATDASPGIARSYAGRHSQIRVVDQKNQGLSAARNRGLEEARGKYIYFIDSDDYLAYNTLGYALGLMKSLDLDLLGLGVTHTERLDQWHSKNYEVIGNEAVAVCDGITYIAQNRYLNNAWWYLIRREYLLETGLRFPIGRYFEDCFFTASLIAQGSRVARTSLDFYRYVLRPNSITNTKTREHSLKLIGDYEKNVYDFGPLIETTRNRNHPDAGACSVRLEARQYSFVFYMFVMCIRNRLGKKEVAPIIERLEAFGAYPIKKSFLTDYGQNRAYPVMRYVMNNRNLFFFFLNVLPIFNKFMPQLYHSVNRLVRRAQR